jgi:hypothetical protein
MNTNIKVTIPAPLELYTSEELMREIKRRRDIVILGNFYSKQQITDLCGATPEEADAFLDECDPADNDAVLENANLELQELFDTWKEEREQECE